MPRQQTEIDIEILLQWAYRDELSKRQLSSAEGIWDRIMEEGQRGPIDHGHGAAQRYAHFGLPDADAELIERAVGSLEDTVIDWERNFDMIAAELAGLITVNDMARRPATPKPRKGGWGVAGAKAVKAWWGEPPQQEPASRRDVLMVGGLRTAALVTMHAIKGSRPDWSEDPPRPLPTPAVRGPNAMVFGECKGKNLYSLGAHCPLRWSPSPLSIVACRSEYVAWHQGLIILSETLRLAKFIVLPPKASLTPWLEATEEEIEPLQVVPTKYNSVDGWGTLPLAPVRDRMGPPLRTHRAGKVRYPQALDNGAIS